MPRKQGRVRGFIWRHSFGIAVLVMAVFIAALGYIGYNYVLITKKFDSSRRWDLPSRIYSDATPLIPGLEFPRTLLEAKLNHVGYHETKAAVANPGEYRFIDTGLEIYLQSFVSRTWSSTPLRFVWRCRVPQCGRSFVSPMGFRSGLFESSRS